MNQEVVLESEKEVKSPEQLRDEQMKVRFEGYLTSSELKIRSLDILGKVERRACREFIEQFFREEAYSEEPLKLEHKLGVARPVLSGTAPFYPEDVARGFNKLVQEEARDVALRGMLNWARTLVVERAAEHRMSIRELNLVARLARKGRGEVTANNEELQEELRSILKKHLSSFSYLRGYEQVRHGEDEAGDDRTEWMDREMQEYGFAVNPETHSYVDATMGEEFEAGDGESFLKGRRLPETIAFEEAADRARIEKAAAGQKKAEANQRKVEAVRGQLKEKPQEGESVALLSAEENNLRVQRDGFFRKYQELDSKLSGAGGFLRGLINPSYKKDLEVAKEQLAVFNEQIIEKKRQIAQLER